MSWDTSDRRSRLPSDWSDRVRKIWSRDGGRCTWRLRSGKRCPRPGADVDHRVNNDNHELDNLQLLCRTHHDRKTQMEARAGRLAKKPKKRPEERHPGLFR